MMKDPVCGADVDEKTIPAISTYHGRHYLFCGRECKNTFDEDPEEYIPLKISREQRNGGQFRLKTFVFRQSPLAR